MEKIKALFRRYFCGLPIISIVLTSFLPLQLHAQQALVLFTLIWFYVFLLFDVFAK
jgi:hypothetical protein